MFIYWNQLDRKEDGVPQVLVPKRIWAELKSYRSLSEQLWHQYDADVKLEVRYAKLGVACFVTFVVSFFVAAFAGWFDLKSPPDVLAGFYAWSILLIFSGVGCIGYSCQCRPGKKRGDREVGLLEFERILRPFADRMEKLMRALSHGRYESDYFDWDDARLHARAEEVLHKQVEKIITLRNSGDVRGSASGENEFRGLYSIFQDFGIVSKRFWEFFPDSIPVSQW